MRLISTPISLSLCRPSGQRPPLAGSAAVALAAFFLSLLAALPAQAQHHFADCATRTGASATVVLPASAALTIDEAALQPGDEIAAFASSGQCAGYTVWRGDTAALTVWGDDAMTRSVEGYQARDTLQFRLWDASEAAEYHAGNAQIDVVLRTNRPYARADLTFIPDGIYILDRLIFVPLRQAKR